MVGVVKLLYAAGGAVALVVVLALAVLYYRERRRLEAEANDALRDAEDGETTLKPPDVGTSLWDMVKLWRHHAKAKRMARNGYVRWYRIDSSLHGPSWVKPEAEGAGVREHRHDGVTYLFPDDAMVTDARTGAHIAIHREGEAEPINLRDPAMPPLPADRLEEVINLEAESDAPGLLDRLDLDPKTLLFGGMALMLVLAGAQKFMA